MTTPNDGTGCRSIEPAPTEKKNVILVLKDGEDHARLWEIHNLESGSTTQHHKLLTTGAVCHGKRAESMKTRYERSDCYEFQPSAEGDRDE